MGNDTKKLTHVVHIGDGRFIDHTDGALFPPPPKRSRIPGKAKRLDKAPPLRVPSHKRPNRGNSWAKQAARMNGVREFHQFISTMLHRYHTPFTKASHTDGYNKHQLKELRALAALQVAEDMKNIKKTVELSDMAEEALEGALHVLRSPNSQSTKLSAAKLILEYTKSKPVAKSEVSVNKAEEWLASLNADE